jgi:hypothetical protein
MHYKLFFLGIYKIVLGSNEPLKCYFFQYNLTLGDPLYLMGGDRATGGTPADKRMKGRKGVTEDDITENAITLILSRTGKCYNQKTL